jgi:tetratricopeptide (TPR) repeat protein
VRRKLGFYEDAIEDYTQEIHYGSSNVIKAFNYRAYCYVKNLQYELAINDYNAVLNSDPSNTHALHNKGISYE